MKVTIIINDAPYGTEKAWNAIRYADSLLARDVRVNIFLMADAVSCAKTGQAVPTGYYNIEQALVKLIEKGVNVKSCGTCCKARGLSQNDIVEGAEIGKMLDLADWTVESDKVITF